jgi:formamidopyrimidine-DNA glycosylase
LNYDNQLLFYAKFARTGGKLLADRALSQLLRVDWPRTVEELERRRKGLD